MIEFRDLQNELLMAILMVKERENEKDLHSAKSFNNLQRKIFRAVEIENRAKSGGESEVLEFQSIVMGLKSRVIDWISSGPDEKNEPESEMQR